MCSLHDAAVALRTFAATLAGAIEDMVAAHHAVKTREHWARCRAGKER